MPVNPRKLGLCEPSAADFVEEAEGEDDPAVPLADDALELALTWLGYNDPRGSIVNGSEVAKI